MAQVSGLYKYVVWILQRTTICTCNNMYLLSIFKASMKTCFLNIHLNQPMNPTRKTSNKHLSIFTNLSSVKTVHTINNFSFFGRGVRVKGHKIRDGVQCSLRTFWWDHVAKVTSAAAPIVRSSPANSDARLRYATRRRSWRCPKPWPAGGSTSFEVSESGPR